MIVELEKEHPNQTHFWIAMGKPCHAWQHPDGNFEGRMNQLEQVPEGFLNGETWRRFCTEDPNPEVELVEA